MRRRRRTHQNDGVRRDGRLRLNLAHLAELLHRPVVLAAKGVCRALELSNLGLGVAVGALLAHEARHGCGNLVVARARKLVVLAERARDALLLIGNRFAQLLHLVAHLDRRNVIFSYTALEIIRTHGQIRKLRTKPRDQTIVHDKGVVRTGTCGTLHSGLGLGHRDPRTGEMGLEASRFARSAAPPGIASKVVGNFVVKNRALCVAGLPLQFVDTLLHDLAGHLRRFDFAGNAGVQISFDHRVGNR